MLMRKIHSIILSFYVLDSVSGNLTDIEYAKIPPIFHMDNYDECAFLKDKALFCSFTYTFAASPMNNWWKTLKILSSEPYNYKHTRLRHGICVQKTCPSINISRTNLTNLSHEIKTCYDEKFKDTGLNGTVSGLRCEDSKSKLILDAFDIIIALLFFAYIAFVLIASLLDLRKENEEVSTFSAFSIPRNWNKLKTVQKCPDVERLRSIQGIKFMNTVLVILTHTMMLNFMLPISNTKITETLSENLTVLTIFLTSGPLCVSTFFMISSWLLVHRIIEKALTWKELLLIFVHRYVRLMPTLGLVVAFTSTWLRHMGDGPKWDHYVGREYSQCRKNGWTNILFVNNLVDPGNMCLQTTWYMGLEFQYFTITLLILAIRMKYPKSFWWILGTLLPASMFLTFMENYEHDFPAILLPKAESLYDLKHTLKNKQFLIQYIGFRGNLAGPLIGLGFGYVYSKNKEKKLFTKKIHYILWWPVTHMLTYGIIIIPGMLALSQSIDHSRFWASLHIAFSRPIFAFGMGFALLGMTHGAGGFMKWVFEWPPVYILGRLTYSAYLIHMPLLLLKVGSIRSPVYLNVYNLFLDFVGSVAVTYLAATVLFLLFEMPMAELQNMVMMPKTHRNKISETSKKE